MTRYILDSTNAEDIVVTAQIKKASELFKKHGSLILCGKAGEGKSTAAHYILKKYEKRHRCVILAGEVTADISISDFDIVVFDDVLARYNIARLLPLLNTIKYRNENCDLKFIFILKDQLILKEVEVKFGLHKLFKQIITFSSADLSVIEKEKILEKILFREKKDPSCIKINLCTRFSSTQIGFPYCCTLFASENSLFAKREQFFERPYRALVAHIHNLIPEEELVLTLLFLCGGMVRATCVETEFEKIQHPMLSRLQKNITEQSQHTGCYKESYRETLRRLKKGVYVKLQNDHYSFAHSIIYESMGITLLDKEICGEAIRNCNIHFLSNCIIAKSHEETEDDDTFLQGEDDMLMLDEDSWSYLAGRLIHEVCANDNLDIVACHQALNSEVFVNFMFDHMEEPDLFLRKEKHIEGRTIWFSTETIKNNSANLHLTEKLVTLLECQNGSHDALDDCWRCNQLSHMFLECCESGSSSVYKLLRRHIRKLNNDHLKSAIVGRNKEIVKYVLDNMKCHGVQYTEDSSIVFEATRCGCSDEILDLLVEYGFQIAAKHIWMTVLNCFCKNSTKHCHHTQLLNHMMNIIKDNGTFDNKNGYIVVATIFSALKGKFEMNKLLMQQGVRCKTIWLTMSILLTLCQLNGLDLHQDEELRYTLIRQVLLLLERIKSNGVQFPDFYKSFPEIPEPDFESVQKLFSLGSTRHDINRSGVCKLEAHNQLISSTNDLYEKLLKLLEMHNSGDYCDNCSCVEETILALQESGNWNANEPRVITALNCAGTAGCFGVFSVLLDHGANVTINTVLNTIGSCSATCVISNCGHSKITFVSLQRLKACSSLPIDIPNWRKACSKACKKGRHELCKILAYAGIVEMPKCMELPQDVKCLKYEELCNKHQSVVERIIEQFQIHNMWDPEDKTVLEFCLQVCLNGDYEKFRILSKCGVSIDSDHIVELLKHCKCYWSECGHKCILYAIGNSMHVSEYSQLDVCKRITGKQAQISIPNPLRQRPISNMYRKIFSYIKECFEAIRELMLPLATEGNQKDFSIVLDQLEELCSVLSVAKSTMLDMFQRIPSEIVNLPLLFVLNTKENKEIACDMILKYMLCARLEDYWIRFQDLFVELLPRYCIEKASLFPIPVFIQSWKTISRNTTAVLLDILLCLRDNNRDLCIRLLIRKAIFSKVWDPESDICINALTRACCLGDHMMFNALTKVNVNPTLQMVQMLIQDHFLTSHDCLQKHKSKYRTQSESRVRTKCVHVTFVENIIAVMKKKGIWNPASVKVVTTMDQGGEDEMLDILKKERITVRRHSCFDRSLSAYIGPVRVHILSEKRSNVEVIYTRAQNTYEKPLKEAKAKGVVVERPSLIHVWAPIYTIINRFRGLLATANSYEELQQSPEPTMTDLFNILKEHFKTCRGRTPCHHIRPVEGLITQLKADGRWNPLSLVITQVTEVDYEDPLLNILRDVGLDVKKPSYLLQSKLSLQVFRVRLRR